MVTADDRIAMALNKIAEMTSQSESDPRAMRLLLADVALIANRALAEDAAVKADRTLYEIVWDSTKSTVKA